MNSCHKKGFGTSLNLERNWYWRKKYLVIETAYCVKTLCLEKRPWLVEIGTSRSFSSKSIRPMNWLCEYGSDPHCRVLPCTASSSGEQAETGVPWRVPVVHGRTTPWECHPAVDMTSHNHPAIGCLASPPSQSETSDKRCPRIGVWVSTCLWLPPMSTKPHCAHRDSQQTPHMLRNYQL